jgi:hypothetical protein
LPLPIGSPLEAAAQEQQQKQQQEQQEEELADEDAAGECEHQDDDEQYDEHSGSDRSLTGGEPYSHPPADVNLQHMAITLKP